MKLSIEDRLGQICQHINDNGFYVGFYSQEDFSNRSSDIKKNIEDEVSFKKYNNFLHSPFEAVNPRLETTVLYKVDSRLFKAFPIHWDKKAFERFFAPSALVEKLSGIVIVSHRLKMLSFLWACYDPIDQDEEHLALLFNLERERLNGQVQLDLLMHQENAQFSIQTLFMQAITMHLRVDEVMALLHGKYA